ncbi:MAG: hypothetical protein Q7K55_04685 [Candidatus Levybacteria bacterium]|nr:hypothetical protein [Candidatus Levybacteria bacterium]
MTNPFLNKKNCFVYIIVFIVLIFSLFKIHGSSIGIYNYFFYGSNFKDSNLLMGQPRSVRGDEWLVGTPSVYIAQARNFFNQINKNIGIGQKIITPSKNLFNIFYPAHFAFFILPVEYAFSWFWWFRGGLMIVSVYVFLLLITKKNILLSITGSLLFFFNPFIQWWYSTWVLEVIFYGFLIIYFFIRFLNSKSNISFLINSFFLTYFLICYALSLYPPYQISMGLFIIFFLIGYIVNNKKLIDKTRIKTYLISAGTIFFIVIGVLLAYYVSFADLIHLLQNTSYPGKRQIVSGGYSIINLFSGFYDIEFLDEAKQIPPILGDNKSEASNFFMLFPFILPVIMYYSISDYIKKKKIDFISLFLCLYLILTTIWIFFGLPSFISKSLLLNLVPHNRMIIGMGAANLILIIYFLNNFRIRKSRDYKIFVYFISVFALLIYLYIGFFFGSNYQYFINSVPKIIFISFFAFFSILFLLLQKRKLFISVFLFFSIISSISVNPLYKGLSPILDSEFSKAVKQIEKENTNKDRWVVYDNFLYGNLLIANGINSMNFVQMYPQLKLWQEFDPDKKYYPIYNRLAHVLFSSNDPNKIDFVLNHYEFFTVRVNPCNKIMDKFRVRYYIFNKKVSYSCLREIKKINFPNMPTFIYKRT